MNKLIRLFSNTSIIKTLYFNFYYFNFATAIKFPVFVSKNMILKKVSGKVLLLDTFHTGNIRLGFESVGIFDNKRSKGIWELNGEIIFKGIAFLGQGVKVSVGQNAIIEFGDNISVTAETQIVSQKKIVFGRDCLISWDCLIMDTDFHKIFKDEELLNPPKEVIIGNKVWIGCRNTILKGTVISDGSIIGACSIVSSRLEESNVIYSGNPAKKVKENITWTL